jgi:glutathione synthase/RimK-type ligase-like ATP-grasp enzyme
MFLVKSVVRLGSTTVIEDAVSLGGDVIEINTIEAVKNSSNKLLMKQCFQKAKVNTADWFLRNAEGEFIPQLGVADNPKAVPTNKLPYPLLAKSKFGSRGTGNYKLDSEDELKAFLAKKDTSNYIFERYYNYAREYRLHVSTNGCFYTNRKMLKRDALNPDKWQRHDDNCVWFVEENPGFDKPVNWDEILDHCKRALEATGLDVASFDVRVQSANGKNGKPRERCEFIVIECNSASSFGKGTAEKYLEELPKLILKKASEYAMIKEKK